MVLKRFLSTFRSASYGSIAVWILGFFIGVAIAFFFMTASLLTLMEGVEEGLKERAKDLTTAFWIGTPIFGFTLSVLLEKSWLGGMVSCFARSLAWGAGVGVLIVGGVTLTPVAAIGFILFVFLLFGLGALIGFVSDVLFQWVMRRLGRRFGPKEEDKLTRLKREWEAQKSGIEVTPAPSEVTLAPSGDREMVAGPPPQSYCFSIGSGLAREAPSTATRGLRRRPAPPPGRFRTQFE